MTKEENKRRQEDEHVLYIKEHLYNKDKKQPFVFVSYKSDDWEVALSDVVYRLVKEYGLHVYFDGDFDTHNSLWIKQFPANMNSEYCKGVLAFVDNKYTTSYATLLEMMHSQARLDKKGKLMDALKVVPVNLEKLKDIDDDESTGLGDKKYADGTLNNNAEEEQNLFEKLYKRLKGTVLYDKLYNQYDVYKDSGRTLSKELCSSMMNELLAYIKVNDNNYEKGDSLDNIKRTIENTFGESVFSPVKPGGGTGNGGGTTLPTSEHGTLSVAAFGKLFSNATMKKDSFQKLRIVGNGEYAKYTTPYADSITNLVWGFLMECLKQNPDLIRMTNEKHSNLAKPIFITSQQYDSLSFGKEKNLYRQVDADGLTNWYMYKNYSQYNWISPVLKTRILDFEMPLGAFEIEYENATKEAWDIIELYLISDPVPDGSSFEYEILGTTYYSAKLAEMMHQCFDVIIQKYPHKAQAMADSAFISCVARKEDIDKNLLPPNKMSYFRARKEHSTEQGIYYVGTSYGRKEAFKQIERMLKECCGSADAFVINKEPEIQKKNSFNEINKKQPLDVENM